MATYNFGTITTTEAANYKASTDDLRFDGVREATATNTTVLGTLIRINTTGAQVNLGWQAQGDVLTFPDGSILALPGDQRATITGGAGNDHLYGGNENDHLLGGGGDDILEGDAFEDQLDGGRGADTLTGGAGVDRFYFAPGDSGTIEGRLDVITDWQSNEKIAVGAALDGYVEFTAASYTEALAKAGEAIASGAADVVAIRVGDDVFLFLDSRGDGGVADDAIILRGKNLDFISAANVVTDSSAPPSTSQPPSSSGGRQGGAGADTIVATDYLGELLVGNGGDDRLRGGTGADSLYGGEGNDTLEGYFGADIVSGGDGNDVILAYDGADTITLGAGADLVRVNGFQFAEGEEARILDWSPQDAIRFVTDAGAYAEGTASDFAAAKTLALTLARDGYRIVSVQVGADVLVFGNFLNGSRFDSFIRLVGRTLDDISGGNVGIWTNPTLAEPAGASAAPSRATSGSTLIVGNMDNLNTNVLDAGDVGEVTATRIVLDGPGLDIILTGHDFSTDAARQVLFGSVTGFSLNSSQAGSLQINATVGAQSLQTIINALDFGTAANVLGAVFAGSDRITGSGGADLIRAFFGDDIVSGGGGADTIYGGGGNDVIYAAGPGGGGGSSTYLRGDEGDDWIQGGDAFDDINGNQGNDTASGGAGNDWVVGGKDADQLFGDAGDDIVYGNVGSDVCSGGDGNDIVRGGQDNDRVFGGAGDDFVSGDKGDDTMSGGGGADIFHSFGDAGLDRIIDFNQAEGDRLMLAPGTQYTLSQLGQDTIVTMTGGGRAVLVGVALDSLTPGWIFGA